MKHNTTSVEARSRASPPSPAEGSAASNRLNIGANNSCDTGAPMLRIRNTMTNSVTVRGSATTVPANR